MPIPIEQEFTNPYENEPEPVEKVQEAIRLFLVDAQIGTPKLAAFSDYTSYRNLTLAHSNTLKEVQHAKKVMRGEEVTLVQEMQLVEHKEMEDIALEEVIAMGTLRAHIIVEQSRTPGYAIFYEQTDNLRERLENAYQYSGESNYISKAYLDMRHATETNLLKQLGNSNSQAEER